MAYLSQYKPYEEEQDQTGGLLGTGGEMGGGVPQKSTAGAPGGWTNIQEYINANKGDMTNVNTLKNKATDIMGKGASEVERQKGSLSALPTAQGYDPDKLQESLASDKYDTLKGYTNQQADYKPTNEELLGYNPLEESIGKVKQGDFNSIMGFFGDERKTTPTYTPGMKTFDKMLLQGNPYVQKEFVPELQNMYKTQYSDPLSAARTERDAAKTKTGEDFGKASTDWKTGITDYVGGEEGNINKRYKQQNKHYSGMEKTANQDIDSMIAQYTQSVGSPPSPEIINEWTRAKKRASDFLSKHKAPSTSTAYTAYINEAADKTKNSDLEALYQLMGKSPTYTYNPQDIYDEIAFM